MSELKITTGKAFVSIEDTFGSQPRVETEEKLICCVGNGEGYLLALDEWTANADLIAEAFNSANETGLTPRQLVEHRDELIRLHRINVSTMVVTKHRLSEKGLPSAELDVAIRETEQAIAKAEGRS